MVMLTAFIFSIHTVTVTANHYLFIYYYYYDRNSCNPEILFDAEVEKYCPDNMKQIKVQLLNFFICL